jgi:hypothetical protein
MRLYKEVHPMSYPIVCPSCGAVQIDDRRSSGKDAAQTQGQSGTTFARILNGTPWKQKPMAPPRHRDDVVPYD